MAMNLVYVVLLCINLVSAEGVVRRPLSIRRDGLTSTTPISFEGTESEDTLKCICDGGCEHLRGNDCPFGLTFDMCKCCLVCARGENEPCGDALGNCAEGLHCKIDPSAATNSTDAQIGEGRCSRDDGGCGGQIEVRFGCTIGPEGDCKCSSRSGCPEERLFAFDSEEECRSRMAFLIAKKDLEVPEQRTTSATDDCTKVQCPYLDLSPCPADSYRLPARIDHLPNPSEEKRCCPLPPEKCQCIPGLHCPQPGCSPGSSPVISENGTEEPGHCCPTFKCVSATDGKDYTECKYNGQKYSSGETWANRKECTECVCQSGVVSCKPIKCDLPQRCPLVSTPPNSCCPICAGCVTASGGVYNNSETWEEDPCTTCTCNEGRVQCHATMCHTTCSNPVHVAGECCPICSDGSDHHSSCPFLDCHKTECPTAFKLDRLGCPTCECSSRRFTVFSHCPDMAACDLHCPYGFRLDEDHCSLCKCREELSGGVTDEHNEEDETTKNVLSPEKHCFPSEGIPRRDGEEWADRCRRCICKNGQEMCTLITCHPPNCEHPIFYPGDCCPRCPDEQVGHINFSISVCQSSDGTERLEGETWNLGPCLRCTCHSGQVLCSAPTCPPTPCPRQMVSSPDQCCPSCPKNENAITTDSSSHLRCLSDDSLKSYADRETWKVGVCQSCICKSGSIHCYSVGKCPPLDCERPVLAKNQCCPTCIDHRSSSKDGREDTSLRTAEPYCTLLIGVVLGLSLVLGVVLFRHWVWRRACPSSRLVKIKKAPPSFHSSNSSQDTPPVTPDCCYKCDYNNYTSCAQLSEQKPLFNPSSSSGGSNSDKV